ncbi:MAG: undecaprenyl-diphosphate phosphatase [Gammaproteobacteria bacterium]|nr:undecaprenyl-diphosphate phosphatase [Gammaproteobacteria bacterium]
MDTLHAIFLALLQGLTEFLPISSSGHLVLLPTMFGWQMQSLSFDVAVHVGTLIAVVAYFRHELIVMSKDWYQSILQRKMVGESCLPWAVLWGTVPVAIIGLLFDDFIEINLRSPLVIAIATILFGAILWWADISGKRKRTEHEVALKDILIIGIAQALALIPGASRSGVTITAGLMLGLTRKAAARFSFLLSIPVIALAGGYQTFKLIRTDAEIHWDYLAIGLVVSAVTAYLCIHVFLKLLDRVGMLPFVIYRFILGAVLLYYIYLRPGFFVNV